MTKLNPYEAEVSAQVEAILDFVLERHRIGPIDDPEYAVECHMCGGWEYHKADCAVPALQRWLQGDAPRG